MYCITNDCFLVIRFRQVGFVAYLTRVNGQKLDCSVDYNLIYSFMLAVVIDDSSIVKMIAMYDQAQIRTVS